jgi:CrcB protein
MPANDLAALILPLALGSALGGVARFWLGALVQRLLGEGFPWGTLTVNLSGAFLAGWVGAALQNGLLGGPATAFLLTGFLGSYTTVSALSLQTLELERQGRRGAAFGNLGGTLALGLSGAAAGFLLGMRLHG